MKHLCSLLLLLIWLGVMAHPAIGADTPAPPPPAIPAVPAPAAPTPADTDEAKAADWFRQGMDAAKVNDGVKMVADLRQAVTLAPANLAYVETLAKALRVTAQFADAETFLLAKMPAFPTPDDQRRLLIALADVYFYHGAALGDASHFEDAISQYQAALAIDRPLRHADAGIDLNNLGSAYDSLSQYAKAIDCFNQSLPFRREVKDRRGEAITLNNIGLAYENLSRYEKAIDFFGQALPIDREVKDRRGEAITLNNLGSACQHLSRHEQALAFYAQALPIAQETGDQEAEAATLGNLGLVDHSLGEYDKALALYEQSLAIHRQIKDRGGEAGALVNIGTVYDDLGQYDKAIDFFTQALPVQRELKDRAREAITLNNLGSAYQHLSQYDKAIESYEQALPIERDIGDQVTEAATLNGLGSADNALGQYDKAAGELTLALPIQRAIKDREGEAATLGNLGLIADNLKQYAKSIDFYQQSLAIHRQIKDRDGEAVMLNNLGSVSQHQGRNQPAIAFYRQALTLQRELKDRQGEAASLNNLGTAYAALTQYAEAIDYFGQALPIRREIKDRAGEASTLNNLMFSWSELGKAKLAVFYGKQAVNVFQDIRAGLQGMDANTQKTYLAAHEATYRDLADLLIGSGRLPEAQQVLDLLKQEEYFQFVRRDAKEADAAGGAADLTPAEADWESRYAAISDQIVALGQEDAALTALPTRTPDQEKRLATLDSDLEAAQRHFKQFLQDLTAQFDSKQAASDKITDIKETQAMMGDLQALGPGTVLLTTLVGKNNYSVILMTGETRKAAQANPPVSAAALNQKILAFRAVLQNPDADPRPQALELYKILVGPIEKDLAQAGAKTLMWSLDGDLRYLPVAALFDGKHYLVERYRSALFTPASAAHLKDVPQPVWTALGLGVSQPHSVTDSVSNEKLDFASLPAVPAELSGIIQDSAGTTQGGILPGKVLLDPAFTRAAMRSALRLHYPVVHIASHFRFHSGDDDRSFLLLGDGTPFSLAQIEDETNLFEGVDLLTLSACNTGMGDTDADGREVDGLGILAQRQGAKAIIATLWPVADASTRLLMEQFYARRQAPPGVSKAEAMQEAQLALLRGEVGGTDAATNRGTEAVPSRGEPADAPPFTPDPKAPYAHPYYWAPFILIGNWK